MEPIVFPPSTASTRDLLNFYREEKLQNLQMAEHINKIKASNYSYTIQCLLCNPLSAKIHDREAQLSPLGNRICQAILQLPDVKDQMAIELRYLDLMTLKQVAVELHCSTDTVGRRIRRAIGQMHLGNKAK